MNGSFIRNLESDKVELHFSKADYMALPDSEKSAIKSACLFSGRAGCWVSRATVKHDWRAVQVAKSLGLTDDGETGERLSFAEQQDRIVEKAEARAERMEVHAENAERRSDQAYKRADLREKVSGIPLGQPILVGHHSERRHRRAIERADNAMRKSCEESDKAKYFAGRAEAARCTANQGQMQDKTYLQNRIDENAAQIRDCDRRMAGQGWLSETGPTEDYKARLAVLKAEYQEKLNYFQQALDLLGGVKFSRLNVKPGDKVKIRGRWEIVVKANPKTVASSSGVMPWPLKHVWAEVQDHEPKPNQIAETKTEELCEGRTIWNSDGTNGPCLICLPPANVTT